MAEMRNVYLSNLLLAADRSYESGTRVKVAGELTVKNIGFEKSVHIIYTLNGWEHIEYVKAMWHSNIEDTDLEKWTFTYFLPTEDSAYENPSEVNMEFKVQLTGTGHAEYVDDNMGNGYCYNLKRPSLVYDKWQSVRVRAYTWEPFQKKAMGVLATPNSKADGDVAIRYTFDFWKTTKDLAVDEAYFGTETKYTTFKVELNENNVFEFVARNKLVGAADFWDNNCGRNFGFFPGRVLVQKPKPVVEEIVEVEVDKKEKEAVEI